MLSAESDAVKVDFHENISLMFEQLINDLRIHKLKQLSIWGLEIIRGPRWGCSKTGNHIYSVCNSICRPN